MGHGKERYTLILQAFPGQGELIERGLAEQPSFHELCEDYRRCANAIERWRQGSEADAPARIQEYETLLAELTREIGACLETLGKEQAARDEAPNG